MAVVVVAVVVRAVVVAVDLVASQLAIAAGASLADLGLMQSQVRAPRGYAMQLRVNMETMDESGNARPTGGTVAVFQPPSGPGVRVDTFGYPGYRTCAAFDSLLAKLIVHSGTPRFADVVSKARRALRELRIEGVATNAPFLEALLAHPDFAANRVNTRFIDERLGELLRAPMQAERLYIATESAASTGAGAVSSSVQAPDGTVAVVSPQQGTVVSVDVAPGERVRVGQTVAVLAQATSQPSHAPVTITKTSAQYMAKRTLKNLQNLKNGLTKSQKVLSQVMFQHTYVSNKAKHL